MNRWLERLHAKSAAPLPAPTGGCYTKSAAPPLAPTDRTDKSPFCQFCQCHPGGVQGNSCNRPAGAERLDEADAERLREDFTERSAIIEYDAGRPRAEAEAAARASIEARLLRWRWPPDEALATAERIARRRSPPDMASCVECTHLRPGRCANWKRAGLLCADIGRELAVLEQRCSGFEPNNERGPQP